MECSGNVELGRRVRYVCDLSSSSNGCLSALSSREQEGLLRSSGLRGRVGRVQSLVSLLLHVSVGEAEQSLSSLSTRMVDTENGQVGCPDDSRSRASPVTTNRLSPKKKKQKTKVPMSKLSNYFL